jgi:transposase-like protein
MAEDVRMTLEALLREVELEEDIDFLRGVVRVLSQTEVELEVTQRLGAGRHERTASYTGQCNGYRERQGDTRMGAIDPAGQ